MTLALVGSSYGAEGCRATTEIWAMSKDYVAIRDLEMCGVAMPRRPVSRVEDPRRLSIVGATRKIVPPHH